MDQNQDHTTMPQFTPEEMATMSQRPLRQPPDGVVANVGMIQQPAHVVPAIITMVVACTTFVALRITARTVIHRELRWDDGLSLFALIGLNVFLGVYYLTVQCGLGTHFWDLRVIQFSRMLQMIFVTDLLYPIVLYLATLSIVLQLRRIFVPNRHHDALLFYGLYIVAIGHLCLAITGVFLTVFRCRPIESSWNLFISGNCVSGVTWVTVPGFIRVILEFVLLIIPIPAIWKLQMSLGKKIAVSALFGTGLVTCGLSIARPAYSELLNYSARSIDQSDYSRDFEIIILLSSLEIALTICVGCIPTLPKLFNLAAGRISLWWLSRRSEAQPHSVMIEQRSRPWRLSTIRFHTTGMRSTSLSSLQPLSNEVGQHTS